MKSIQVIVELAESVRDGDKLALATVMQVRGSAYRRPGARMLITAEGRTTGTISGGCLESDVRERAMTVMASGKAQLVTYDSTAPDDIVFGLGLGCNGVVEVLIEPLDPREESDLLAFFSACLARRQIGRIVTVFQSGHLPLGARLLRWPDGALTAQSLDPASTDALTRAFHEVSAPRPALQDIELSGGHSARVLIEAVAPPVPLTIFGAADDAIPVARLARLLGWHVTVVDARPGYATAERFPSVNAVYCVRPESLISDPRIILPPDSVFMIMTHNFQQDRELLRLLLPRMASYLGILGPKMRTERLLGELADEGVVFNPGSLARLHGPAGLDLGAESPEEIAVSIIGEIQAVLAGREAGFLRDRDAPIHDPVDQPITRA